MWPVQMLAGNGVVKDVFTGYDDTFLLCQPGAGKQVFRQTIVFRLFLAGLPGVGCPPFLSAQIAATDAKPLLISRRLSRFVNEVVEPFLAHNFFLK
jgi:hypothetical protein